MEKSKRANDLETKYNHAGEEFQRFDDSDRDQRGDYGDCADFGNRGDYYNVDGKPEGKVKGGKNEDYPGDGECDDLLVPQFFFCPYCGQPEATPDLVEWGEGWLRQEGSDPYMLDFVCVQGHCWGKLPPPLRERQRPWLRSEPSDPNNLYPVSGSPTDEPVLIDVSSLIAIVCPYCAMGPSEGTYIEDAYPFDLNDRRAVVSCRCDNHHEWSLLLALDNKHRRIPVTCVFLDPDYFSESAYPGPEFEVDAVL